MSTKLSTLKRAIGAAKKAMGPQQYGVQGKPFVCRFCGHDRFNVKQIPLLLMHTLDCAECGHAEFFSQPPPAI